MILRYFFILTILIVIAPSLQAQRLVADDDTLFFALPEQVTVTATRIPTALQNAPAGTDIFTADNIAALPALRLPDILALATGTSIRDYGGTGSLQLTSLRGLGAEYTLVLLDGMRLNSAQNALVDVSQISLHAVERVEVVRGGLASLYGSNALGGVVNIVPSRERAPVAFKLGYGAFGWKQASLSVGKNGPATRLFADVRYEDSDNDFEFNPSWGGAPLRRQHASIRRRGAGAGGTLLLNNANLTVFADIQHLDTGTPGAVFSPSQGHARQTDMQGLLTLRLDMQLAAHRQLRAMIGGRSGRQDYHNPDISINGETLHSRYEQRQLFASVLFDHAFAAGHRLLTGLETAFDALDGNGIAHNPQRVQTAVFSSADFRLHPAGLPLRLYPALRYDMIRDVLSTGDVASSAHLDTPLHALMPSLGLHATVIPGALALRGRAARSFSMPTFNQLYWREGGNASLRPEYSTALEAGVVHTPDNGFPTTEITAFYHDITDKIVWAPSAGLYWTPRNVQHVVSSGLETQLQFRWERLFLRASGQWLSARKVNTSFPGDATEGKQLIYVPEWSASLTLIASPFDGLTISVTERILGRRYYTESNTAFLPAHAITDIAIQGTVLPAGIRGTLKLEVLNLFDASYQVVAFYPMPGRHARLTLHSAVR